MSNKEFETLSAEELSYIQGGGMISTLYMGYRKPVSVESVGQSGRAMIHIYHNPYDWQNLILPYPIPLCLTNLNKIKFSFSLINNHSFLNYFLNIFIYKYIY